MPDIATSAIRVQGGREREAMQAFPLFSNDHPVVGHKCAACGDELRARDVATIIPLGPGADEEAQVKASMGGWYSAWGVIAHASCAGIGDEA